MHPLLLIALLLGASQSPAGRAIEVAGLKPGERAVAIDGAGIRHSDAEVWVHPRFLDATTGLPLEGVLLELHQEDEGLPPNAETLMLKRTSAADGGVHVPLVAGARRADKVRISKPGYESTTLDAGDLFDGDVALFPALALEGSVVDLDGAPIAGATVRTRQTCKHAVPAVETVTDASGRFRFPGFPSIARGCDVEVLAPDHAARADWSGRDLARERELYGAIELRLPRRLGFDLVVLDAGGKPLAGRRVVNLVAPLASERTDANGRTRLPPLAGGRDQVFRVQDGAGASDLSVPCIAQYGETRLRVTPAARDAVDDDAAHGKLALKLAGVPDGLDPAEGPLLQIVDAGGRVALGPGPHVLRAGGASAQVGRAFSGWREVVTEVTIEEGLNELSLTAEREPALEVRLPTFEYATLFVQAGEDSITVDDARIRSGTPLRLHVPPGEPVVLWLESSNGERRRVALAALHGDAVARLDEPACIVRYSPARLALQNVKVRIEVRDAAGAPIPGLDAHFPGEQRYGIEESAVETDVPRGGSFTACLRAEGFRDAWVIGGVSHSGAAETVNVVLTRRAKLTLAGDVVAVEAAGPDPELSEDGWTVDAAPGPLSVRAQRKDGSVIALELELGDGEQRRIEIPAGRAR